MSNLLEWQQYIVDMAVELYGQINPVTPMTTMADCFVYWRGNVLFKFVALDGMTHILTYNLREVKADAFAHSQKESCVCEKDRLSSTMQLAREAA